MLNTTIDKIYLGAATPDSGEGDKKPIAVDYNTLDNRPSINNILLTGNKSLHDLGIQPEGEYAGKSEVVELEADVEANSQDIAGFVSELENKANKNEIPTKTSQLTNDSNYTNKTYVDGEIAKIKQFKREIVDTLPATGREDTLYLMPKADSETGNIYNEYLWINNKWELIGTLEIDLTGYATETYVNTKVSEEATARESVDNALQTSINGKANKATTLSGYGITDAYTKTQIDSSLNNKVDKVSGKGLSTNDYTIADKNKLAGIEAGAQVNPTALKNPASLTIMLNGSSVAAYDGSVAKNVNITPNSIGTYTKAETNNLLNDKQDILEAGSNITITDNVISSSYSNYIGATSSVAGTPGLVPSASSTERTKFLRGDGNWYTPTNTTYSVFSGATSSSNGSSGLVKQPVVGDQNKFLKGNGTWASITQGIEYLGENGVYVNDEYIGVSGESYNPYTDINTSFFKYSPMASTSAGNDGRIFKIEKYGKIVIITIDMYCNGSLSIGNPLQLARFLNSSYSSILSNGRIVAPAQIYIENPVSTTPLQVFIETQVAGSYTYLVLVSNISQTLSNARLQANITYMV